MAAALGFLRAITQGQCWQSKKFPMLNINAFSQNVLCNIKLSLQTFLLIWGNFIYWLLKCQLWRKHFPQLQEGKGFTGFKVTQSQLFDRIWEEWLPYDVDVQYYCNDFNIEMDHWNFPRDSSKILEPVMI